MKIKTSELKGAALDWAVAKCEKALRNWPNYTKLPAYSTDWKEGGPLIEREEISVVFQPQSALWSAESRYSPVVRAKGATLLIAAMRCYVASKLGDEVDVPEELCGRGK